MPRSEDVRAMFTGIAGRYDFLNHLLSFGLDRVWWRQMAALSGARPGTRFLDVAAGTGDSSLALARRGAVVVSTDFTPAMLRLGPAKFRRKGLDALVIASAGADAQALPFREGTFEGVTICYGIRNVEDRAKAFAEFLRVLRPGGRLTILEFSRPRTALLRGVYGLYSRHVLPRIGGWVSGDPSAYTYLPDSIRAFPEQEALARELTASGFRAVRYQDLSGGIVALHTGIREE